MSSDKDEIKMPKEGLSTLVTQFTKRELDRLGRVITSLREKGDSEEKILGVMREQLKRFDAHTLQRIYARSLGKALPDDFEAGNVVKETEVKKNTIVLEVHEMLGQIDQQSLVLYKGEEWYVQWVEEGKYTLKKVL